MSHPALRLVLLLASAGICRAAAQAEAPQAHLPAPDREAARLLAAGEEAAKAKEAMEGLKSNV